MGKNLQGGRARPGWLANVIAEEAIRFLAHEARKCRDRDTCEAFCLLLPAVSRLTGLQPMDDVEAFGFLVDMRQELRDQVNPQAVTHG